LNLLKPYDDKRKEIKEKVNNIVGKACVENLPKEVIDFWHSKYGDKLKVQDCIGVQLLGSWWYIYPNTPIFERAEELVNEPVLKTILEENVEEYNHICDQQDERRNQIKNVLRRLKTYKRIKEEFPEAYTILVGSSDSIEKTMAISKELSLNVRDLRENLKKEKI